MTIRTWFIDEELPRRVPLHVAYIISLMVLWPVSRCYQSKVPAIVSLRFGAIFVGLTELPNEKAFMPCTLGDGRTLLPPSAILKRKPLQLPEMP